MLRLNAQGWNVPDIAKIFQCHQHTVRATIRRWEERGLRGLWEAPGRGAKRKWTEADLDYVINCLENEPRTYNSLQLVNKLKQKRCVDLSSDRLRKLLKKKDISGKEPERAIKESKIPNRKPSSKQI
jgi:transposase